METEKRKTSQARWLTTLSLADSCPRPRFNLEVKLWQRHANKATAENHASRQFSTSYIRVSMATSSPIVAFPLLYLKECRRGSLGKCLSHSLRLCAEVLKGLFQIQLIHGWMEKAQLELRLPARANTGCDGTHAPGAMSRSASMLIVLQKVKRVWEDNE